MTNSKVAQAAVLAVASLLVASRALAQEPGTIVAADIRVQGRAYLFREHQLHREGW